MNGKKIYDPIHGFIPIKSHLLSIIDTQFQVQDLKQLGATHYVFQVQHILGLNIVLIFLSKN